jgi:hypothetical protein
MFIAIFLGMGLIVVCDTINAAPVRARFALILTPLFSQRLRAPGEEMVPLKEPVVVPMKVSYKRSPVKLPVAPAKRPVPPVIVAVSTMDMTPSVSVGMDWPVKLADSESPLAAVK